MCWLWISKYDTRATLTYQAAVQFQSVSRIQTLQTVDRCALNAARVSSWYITDDHRLQLSVNDLIHSADVCLELIVDAAYDAALNANNVCLT